MRLRALLPALLLCALAADPCRGGNGAGNTGAVLFRQPFGARPFALGQAYSALGDDVFGMLYNPATLTRLPDSQAATQFANSYGDTRLGYAALASPLSPNQSLGLGIAYLDAGEAELFDTGGNRLRSVSVERDLAVHLGYSHAVNLGAGRLHLGGLGKALRSVLADEVSATAYGADVGTLYERPLFGGLGSAAAALSNVGPGVRYTGGVATGISDPLPLTMRLGLSYARKTLASDQAAFGLELDRVFYDNKLLAGFGLEYSYRRFYALRLGYRYGQDLGNLSFGMGLNYKNLAVDYAMALVQTFDNIHQVSLRYRFTVPGIRYNPQYLSNPLESLARRAESSLDKRRLFEAAGELERMELFQPNSSEGIRLQEKIQTEIAAILGGGPAEPRYEYAVALQRYRTGDMKEALVHLQAAFLKEPESAEIRDALDRAGKRYQQEQKQLTLQKQATIGTLFELADQAYRAGDFGRATKILQEISRHGPYGPAENLKRQIGAESRKPPPAPAAPAAAPSPERRAQAEQLYYEALRVYAEGKLEMAIHALKEGLALDPTNANLQGTLAILEKELRQKKKAGP